MHTKGGHGPSLFCQLERNYSKSYYYAFMLLIINPCAARTSRISKKPANASLYRLVMNGPEITDQDINQTEPANAFQFIYLNCTK